MWLINAITPDHGTIAGFVKNNRKAFHVTLRNLTLILKGWGLIDGKLIAIDGTKIRAQNSKHNCITKSGFNSGQNRCGIVRIVQEEWTLKHGVLKTILQKPIIIIDSGVFEKHA